MKPVKPVNSKPILIQKPSEEEGQGAVDFIKEKEEANKKEAAKKLAEAELKRKEDLKRIEAEDRIRRKLQKKLEEEEQKEKIKTITDLIQSGKKIKWQLNGPGNRMIGFVKDKIVFEIKKGISVWNLYVKDKSLLKKNQQSYQGCSSNIFELKKKSEKFIK